MKVVIVKPMEPAVITDIDHTLESMQNVVGGYISASYPFDDEVAVVCDDEGMYKWPLNRWVNEYTGWFGTFFICGLTEDSFGDLTDEQAEKYRKMFEHPEFFFRLENGSIIRIRDDIGRTVIKSAG